MKKLFVILLLAAAACGSTAVLTTPGKVYTHTIESVDISCAVIKEWDIGVFRKDGRMNGCWCVLPYGLDRYTGLSRTFQMVPDSWCQEEQNKK
jgi:hypothetical protein